MFFEFWGGPLGLLIVALGCVGLYALFRYFTRSTPIDPIHPGKADTSECKFDRAEASRPHIAPPPPIDVSNLAAPDPRVVEALKKVTVEDVTGLLNQLTGETDAVLLGKRATVWGLWARRLRQPVANFVRILTRNTFSKDFILAVEWVEAYYKKIGIPTYRHEYVRRGRKYINVIAVKKGTTNPEKVLGVGSHLDCTAGDTHRAEARSFGADDDGSGTVGVLKTAEALANIDLPYTVVFCHFSGEEQGLWGSYAFSDKCAEEGMQLIGLLQVDMIGWCAKPGNRIDIHDEVNRNDSHSLTVQLVRNVKRYQLNLNPVDTHNRALQNRSDHAGFLDHGWRAVLISEEFTDDGFNPNYHQPTDRVATLNLPFMCEAVKMIIATAADLVELSRKS